MKGFQNLARLCIGLVMLAVIATLLPSQLRAQTFYGSIVGNVTDASSAIVPGATVTLTNTGTNEKRAAQTNSAGDYSFVSLVPSTYKVEVAKANFKRFVRDQVLVQINSTVRVDAAMQVGAATETVEVTTQAPLLQTDSGTLSDVIEGKTVDAMPLNGRNAMNLLALSADVVPGNYAQGSTTGNHGGHTDWSYWDAYSIGGGASGQSDMYIDGASVNVLGSNTVGYVPAQDSVQEFNVATNATSAEFGRFSGGVINMTTKSGSNVWHGSAYEYLRNRVFNSNEFFNKQTQLASGKANTPLEWNQNQYGVVVDGPVKRDKAFFMFNWEAFKATTSSSNVSLVPTDDMQNGIFAGVNLFTSYPALATLCPSADYNVSHSGATTIPSACWDSSAKVMKTFWPAANMAMTGGNNVSTPMPSGTDTYAYTGRVDYDLSAKQRIFGRYTYNHIADTSANSLPGGKYNGKDWNIGGAATLSRVQSAVLGDTYTFNSTTILDVRLSYMRTTYGSSAPTEHLDDSVFGTNWGALSKTMTDTMVPDISISDNNYRVSSFRGAFFPGHQWNNSEGLTASLTKILGKHSLKFGFEGRYMDRASMSNNNGGGNITFGTSNYTSSAWANLLLGAMDSVQFPNPALTGSYNLYHAYYVNDTWQVNRKLTVNYGLRWELLGNIKEKHDRMMELLPGVVDSNGYAGSAVLVNSVNNSGIGYTDRGTEPSLHDLFAPRLGFAYRMTNNDVVRGGYAYNLTPPDSQSGLFPESMSMNSYTNSWNYPSFTLGAINGPGSLSNPWPANAQNGNAANTLAAAPGRNGFSTSKFYQSTLSAPVATTKHPYQQQWNLSVSHQLKSDLMIQVGYAGSISVHTPIGYQYNELASSHWSDITMLNNTTAACGPYSAGKTTNGQCSRPFPAYTAVNDAVGNIGTQTYESLPIKVEKRFKSGGVLTAAYAWTKVLGTVSATSIPDWNNLKTSKSLGSMSVPQRLVASYVLNLPFGKGQKFLSAVNNGIAQRIISGWTLNGITTLQTGFPVSITESAPTNTYNIPSQYGATLYPNLVSGCNRKLFTKTTASADGTHAVVNESSRQAVINGDALFNINCFSDPPYIATGVTVNGKANQSISGTLGNQRPMDEVVKAPGIANFDLSLQKATKITERVALDFRMEFFNIFNHEQFGAPGSAKNSQGGGGPGGFGSVPFGTITASSQGSNMSPRIGQASLRLTF